jgi:LPXTG-motif cell wall-anchored protein
VLFHNIQGAVVKRIIIASVMAMTVVAAVAAGGAWGAPSSSSGPVITFDDMNNVVTLQIPDPPCPASEPGCVWKFFLNEPKVSVDVSTIYGTEAGTLTLAYPQNFCGIIQADAYIGPTANGPWTPQRGWQHQLPDSDCTTSTTTTSTTQSTVTTTDVPTTPTDVPPSQAGSSAAATVPVATTTTNPPPVPETKAVSTTPSTEPPTVKGEATLTSLPFTGVNLMPFVLLGVGCVALGLGLLFGRRKRTT